MTRKMNQTQKFLTMQANSCLRSDNITKEQADTIHTFITNFLISEHCYHGFDFYDKDKDGSLYRSHVGSIKQFEIR